jgi:predicted esterase
MGKGAFSTVFVAAMKKNAIFLTGFGGFLLLALLSSSLWAPPKVATKERSIKKAMAAELLKLARYCLKKKLLTEGRGHVREALDLDPDSSAAKALLSRLRGDTSAKDFSRRQYNRKWKRFRRWLAHRYRVLFALEHRAEDQPRHDGYLLKAYAHGPKGSRALFDATWRLYYEKKLWGQAYRLLKEGQAIETSSRRTAVLKEVEGKVAESTPLLKKASDHPMAYYLALPKGWSDQREWPILVTVEGAGCNFLGNCKVFLHHRGDLPFILVTPLTFWNTRQLQPDKYPYPRALIEKHDRDMRGRMTFDETGLLKVIETVRKQYRGGKKFFITGFSGGGNLTWRMIFGHPEKLAAASPTGANFTLSGEISRAPERAQLPVKAFQGEKDKYLNMLNAQWARAKGLCDQNGYRNVCREMVPGTGHSACVAQVLAFFRDVLEKK